MQIIVGLIMKCYLFPLVFFYFYFESPDLGGWFLGWSDGGLDHCWKFPYSPHVPVFSWMSFIWLMHCPCFRVGICSSWGTLFCYVNFYIHIIHFADVSNSSHFLTVLCKTFQEPKKSNNPEKNFPSPLSDGKRKSLWKILENVPP